MDRRATAVNQLTSIALSIVCLWFALLARPAFGLNSTISCLDNMTLKETISVDLVNASNTAQIYNTTAYTLTARCPNGCDNVTTACNPSMIEQNLIFLGGFVGMIVLIVALGRWLS